MRLRLTALIRMVLPLFLAGGSAMAQESEPPPSAPLDPAQVRAIMERAVEGFIRPGYHDFLNSSRELETAVNGLCKAPSPAALATANAAFTNTVTAWGRIEIVRTGPAIEQNRFERILYYPDRKGLGLRQVQRLLADKDASATSVAGLAQKSVAVRGLGALEFVLAGNGAEALETSQGDFRCRYGAAVAGSITATAGELAAAWDDPKGASLHWTSPGPDNPVYRDEREAINALLGILVHGAEAVRDQRLESFYKGADKVRFPGQAIFWRSRNTWKSVAANLEGLEQLLKASDMRLMLNSEQAAIASSIDFILKSMIRITATIDTDIRAAVEDETQRGKIDYLLINGKDLILRLNDDYGTAIGLGAGFSFSDGD